MHHHHPALLHRQALIRDRLIVDISHGNFYSRLKLSFSASLFSYSHLSLAQSDLMEFGYSAFGSHWRRYCWSVQQIKVALLAVRGHYTSNIDKLI